MRVLSTDEEDRMVLLSMDANSTVREFPIEEGIIRISPFWSKREPLVHNFLEKDKLSIRPGQSGAFVVRVLHSRDWLRYSLSTQGRPLRIREAEFATSLYSDLRQGMGRKELRAALESIIRRLTDFPYGHPETGRIHKDVEVSAQRFLDLLPYDVSLPKVAPDQEGDLLLVWEHTSPELIVTLEANRLHFVVNPGTRNAEYFDNLEFNRSNLPVELLKVLPKTST